MDDLTASNPLNTSLAGDNSSNNLGKQPATTPPSPTSDMPSEPAAVQEGDVAVPATTPQVDTPTEEPVQVDEGAGGSGVSDMAKPVTPPIPSVESSQQVTGGVGEDTKINEEELGIEPEAKSEDSSPTDSVSDVTSAPSGPVVKPEVPSTQDEPSSALSQEPQASTAEPPMQASQDVTVGAPSEAPVSDAASPSVPDEQPTNPVSEQPDTMSEQVAKPQSVVAETPGGVSTDDDLKKTHEPIIVLPDRLEIGQTVDVKVRVGMVPHVMDDAHYIQSIELFGNDQSFGKIELNPKDNPEPEATFQVPLSAGLKLKAVIYCNVHGKWESKREV